MGKILIIDKDIDLCNELSDFLTQKGYEASVANDSKTGFSLFKTFAPDLVLLSIDLPGVGGLCLLDWIKAINNDAKVIIISAFGTYTNVKLAFKKGAMDFFVKPLNMKNIESKIKSVF
ncbi:MAG: response regulator transcription factor [bacterium]|nr:response regulator transcription factor [bacterium]